MVDKVVGVEQGFSIYEFIKSKGLLILTLFILATIIYVGIRDSYQQKSLVPLIDQTGGRIFASDTIAGQQFNNIISNQELLKSPDYQSTDKSIFYFDWWFVHSHNLIEFFKSIWHKIVIVWILFTSLYFIGFILYLLYKLFNSINQTSKMQNFILALLSLAFLEVIYNISKFLSKNLPALQSSIITTAITAVIFAVIVLLLKTQHKTPVLVIFVIILIIVGFGATIGRNIPSIKDFSDSIIPFKGIWSIISYFPNLMTGKLEGYIMNTSLVPNPI